MRRLLPILLIGFSVVLECQTGLAEDTTPPEGRIIAPAVNFYRYTSGTTFRTNRAAPAIIQDVEVLASDDDSGVGAVFVQISRRGDGGQFWNGETWQPTGVWVPAVFDGVLWIVPDVDFTEVAFHVVRAVISDVDGNVAGDFDVGLAYVATEDPEIKPEAILNFPKSYRDIFPDGTTRDQMEINLTERKGLTFNLKSPFYLESVFAQIRHDDSLTYWNGVEWQADPAWVTCTSARSTFARTNEQVDFFMPGSYQVRFHVRDELGNVLTAAEGVKTTLMFERDDQAPELFFGFEDYYRMTYLPAGAVNNRGDTIAPDDYLFGGRANDIGTGTFRVYVQVRKLADTTFWNGADWEASNTWLPTAVLSGGSPFGAELRKHVWRMYDTVDLSDPGVCRFRIKAFDRSGNLSKPRENPIMDLLVE